MEKVLAPRDVSNSVLLYPFCFDCWGSNVAIFIIVRNYVLILGHTFFSGWDRCVTKHDLSLVSILPFAVKFYGLFSATGCLGIFSVKCFVC